MWFGLSKITPVGPMFAGKPPYQIQVFYNLVLCPWVLGTNSNSPCLLDKWGNGGRETSLTFVGTTASLVHDCMKARDRLNAENLNLLVSSGFAKFAILWWDSNLHPVRRVRGWVQGGKLTIIYKLVPPFMVILLPWKVKKVSLGMYLHTCGQFPLC